MIFRKKFGTKTKLYSGTITCIVAVVMCVTVTLATIAYSSLSTSLTISGEATVEGGPIETFSFTVDTRLTSTGATTGTSTAFSIPTSGYVGGASNHSYIWQINWGDGQTETDSGTSSETSAGISHTYAAAGAYQIKITSNGGAYNGWMDAFGFYSNTSGANASANKCMFKSIDSQLTTRMRTPGSTYRFAYMFYGCANGTGIPANLFGLITDTGSSTSLSNMFNSTFYSYAVNSTSVTIPAGLFSTIDTSSGTDFSYMFRTTFYYYTISSASATIPADLFSAINTSKGTNFSYMFYDTFHDYATGSTSFTIPAGLFSTINTSNGTDFSYMFWSTFGYCAYSSTSGTIPAGLFSTINTSKGTNFLDMFRSTFFNYAYNSTSGTIPTGLFSTINISNETNISEMFRNTFYYYAHARTTVGTDINDIWGSANFAGKVTSANAASMFYLTFYQMTSLGGTAQTFITNKLGGVTPSSSTQAFNGTQVSDLSSLASNWK